MPPARFARRVAARPGMSAAFADGCITRVLVVLGTLLVAACTPSPEPATRAPASGESITFEGTWTAAGHRSTIPLGDARQASIASFEGSLLLSGASRPAVGFRAQAIVLNDSAKGMTGRAVWTDERGDQAYSELRGEGTSTGNRIVGTFIGGSGRWAGLTGEYEFAWRFVLEAEDGAVQGQSVGLKGRARVGAPGAAPAAGATRP